MSAVTPPTKARPPHGTWPRGGPSKEAVIKAWSGSRFAKRPVLPEGIHRDIEVITDMWGRPKVRLAGAIGEHLKDVIIHLSMTHERGYGCRSGCTGRALTQLAASVRVRAAARRQMNAINALFAAVDREINMVAMSDFAQRVRDVLPGGSA